MSRADVFSHGFQLGACLFGSLCVSLNLKTSPFERPACSILKEFFQEERTLRQIQNSSRLGSYSEVLKKRTPSYSPLKINSISKDFISVCVCVTVNQSLSF